MWLYIECQLTFAPILHLLFPCLISPFWARASSLSRFHDHTQTHHIQYDSSWRVISCLHTSVPANTQHSERHIRAPGGIRTHNPSKRVAADSRLIPRGHWDRPILYILLVSNGSLFSNESHRCLSWWLYKMLHIAADNDFLCFGCPEGGGRASRRFAVHRAIKIGGDAKWLSMFESSGAVPSELSSATFPSCCIGSQNIGTNKIQSNTTYLMLILLKCSYIIFLDMFRPFHGPSLGWTHSIVR